MVGRDRLFVSALALTLAGLAVVIANTAFPAIRRIIPVISKSMLFVPFKVFDCSLGSGPFV